MENNIWFLLIVSGFVGAAAGYIGSFMVLKRMSLVGDALSHVALPGIAIAIAFQVSPMIGAFLALTLAVVGIWYFEETSRLYPEALVGIFFTTSLALGILLTPEPDLFEALFGAIENLTLAEGAAVILFSIIIMGLSRLIAKPLLLGVISDELMKSTGGSSRKINLIYLLLVGGIVALGVRFIGTLLMGALVIIPAASAKNISGSMATYYLFSIVFGVASAMIGTALASFTHAASGPMVVLSGISIFLLTHVLKNRLFRANQ